MAEPFDIAEIAEFLPADSVARIVNDGAVLNIASPDKWQVAINLPNTPEQVISQALGQQHGYEHRQEQKEQSRDHKVELSKIAARQKAKKEAAIQKAQADFKAKKEMGQNGNV